MTFANQSRPVCGANIHIDSPWSCKFDDLCKSLSSQSRWGAGDVLGLDKPVRWRDFTRSSYAWTFLPRTNC